MGRIGIIYEDVAQTAHQLQGQGKSPTVDNVRTLLGTGSKSTIARHLKDWKNQQGIHKASDGAIPSELLSLVKGLWDKIQKDTEETIDEYQEQANMQIAEVKKQLQQNERQTIALQQEYDQLDKKLIQQQLENRQLQETLNNERQEKIKLTERVTALNTQQQVQKNEVDRLHQLLHHVQKNLEHYQAAHQELQQEYTLQLDKLRTDYEEKITQLQQQNTVLSSEKFHLSAQHKQLMANLDETKKEIATLKTEQQKLINNHHQQKSVINNLENKNTQLIEQCDKQTKMLDIKNQTVLEQQLELRNKETEFVKLQKTVKKLETLEQKLQNENQHIQNEKAHMYGEIKTLQSLLAKKESSTIIS